MRFPFLVYLLLLIASTNNLLAQLGKLKPKINIGSPEIKINTPKIEIPSPNIGGNHSGGQNSSNKSEPVNNPATVPSTANAKEEVDTNALFTNVHKNDRVSNLLVSKLSDSLFVLEAEVKKSPMDYGRVSKILSSINSELRYLENYSQFGDPPKPAKFNARYNPQKEWAENQIAVNKELKNYETWFPLWEPFTYQKAASTDSALLMSFATLYSDDSKEKSFNFCLPHYINNHRYVSLLRTRDVQELYDDLRIYDSLCLKIANYQPKEALKNKMAGQMSQCQINANKYGLWIASLNTTADFEKRKKGKDIIRPITFLNELKYQCYIIDLLLKDSTVELLPATKIALQNALENSQPIQKETEDYINNGGFQAFLDKLEKEEKLAKLKAVEFPKAQAQNPSLEKRAIDYIKKCNLEASTNVVFEEKLATVIKVNPLTKGRTVLQNILGNPVAEYEQAYVGFKTKSGSCYYIVYEETYAYKGGGKYSTICEYQLYDPVEIACENIK